MSIPRYYYGQEGDPAGHMEGDEHRVRRAAADGTTTSGKLGVETFNSTEVR